MFWRTAHFRTIVLFSFFLVQATSKSPGFSEESSLPPCKASCCRCKAPVNSGQLPETSQKAKTFQDTQRLWPTAHGAETALYSQLSFRFCAPGGLAVAESCGHLVWWPGSLCPSRSLPPSPGEGEVVDLRLSLGSFSFTFPLAGVGTPWLESAPGRPGKTPADFASSASIAHAGCRSASCSQNSMEVQNGRW